MTCRGVLAFEVAGVGWREPHLGGGRAHSWAQSRRQISAGRWRAAGVPFPSESRTRAPSTRLLLPRQRDSGGAFRDSYFRRAGAQNTKPVSIVVPKRRPDPFLPSK